MRRHITLTALALAALALPSAAHAGAGHATTGVGWHPQQAAWHTGAVDGATATLVRNDHGIRYQMRTRDLTPGHVYTLWLVVVNDPGECAGSPCTGGDVLLNGATAAQVAYAAGVVAGGSGRGTFAGHVPVGPLDGWLDGRSLEDAHAAEIHLVVNDHGPAIPSQLADMLHTYRGGCSDDSPFPGIFPPSALADGRPGPNTCRLYQSAIFVP